MGAKNKGIFEYVEKQYNTQIALLRAIDAKIANILVVIGLLLTAAAYLAKIFYGIREYPWLIIFLIPFVFGSYAVIKALFISLKLLRLTNYSVPSLEKKAQAALTELQQMKEIDENETIRELTQNYLSAFNNNQQIMKSRANAYSNILNFLKRGVTLLLISFIGTFIIYWGVANPDVKYRAKEVMTMSENENSQNQNKEPEKKGNTQKGDGGKTLPQDKKDPKNPPKQPSAQDKPTIITAAEQNPDVKIVEIKPDSINLKKNTEKGKTKGK